MKMNDRCLNIINHFGVRNQMKKLHEEVFELLEAIDTYEDGITFEVDYSTLNILRDCMVDELGDVMLLLKQFIAKYEINDTELQLHLDYKLNRTEERIKEGYYDK